MTDLFVELFFALLVPAFFVVAILTCCGNAVYQRSLEKQQMQYEQQRSKP
jgi:hypothetical protein